MSRGWRVAAALVPALALALAACSSSPTPSATSSSAGSSAAGATAPSASSSTTDPGTPTPTPTPTPKVGSVAWLPPATGPGYLQPGSDPSVLPGPLLIADKLNNRLIIVDPQGRVRWVFPRPGDLAAGQTFKIPDDAFFSPDGTQIIATQEDQDVVSIIDIATHKIVYRYGSPGNPGSAPNRVSHPDDALLTPDRHIIVADIINCRVLIIAPGAHTWEQAFGSPARGCVHRPGYSYGSPNGAFPLANGNLLITEINGSWVDEVTVTGKHVWSVHVPGVYYPSDTNEISPGRYLTVDYSSPGQVVIFNRSGVAEWRYKPTGAAALDHPSLALPLPNGDVILNDDKNHRIIVIDPKTNKIVWQYGHTGASGSAPGYLDNPDGMDLMVPFNMMRAEHADPLTAAGL